MDSLFSVAESDPVFAPGKAEAAEERLRAALLKEQYARLAKAQRSLLIVIAGIDGVGKGASVCLLNEWMDARHIHTLAFGDPTPEERSHPFLWRYWRQLPAKGKTGIVFGSWYRPLLAEAASKNPDQEKIQSLAQATREFESTLASNGVQIVKLWYHLSQSAQKKRTAELLSNPDTAWQVRPEDIRAGKKFARLRAAGSLVISLTHGEHVPWRVIPAADPDMRAISTGQAVLAALRDKRRVPSNPGVEAGIVDTTVIPARPRPPTLQAVDYAAKLPDEEYDAQLVQLQSRLARLAQHEKFQDSPVVLVFEGQDAAGKGGTIRRVTHALDARQFRAIPISAPSDEELAHPYLGDSGAICPGPEMSPSSTDPGMAGYWLNAWKNMLRPPNGNAPIRKSISSSRSCRTAAQSS
jgi:polyphosphate kinase 2 (PPK2 family)